MTAEQIDHLRCTLSYLQHNTKLHTLTGRQIIHALKIDLYNQEQKTITKLEQAPVCTTQVRYNQQNLTKQPKREPLTWKTVQLINGLDLDD